MAGMRGRIGVLWLAAGLSLGLFQAAEERGERGGMPGFVYLSEESIRFAQSMLEKDGYLKPGSYRRGERDEATARAIREYQRAHFLRPSGFLDTDTMAMLTPHARPGDAAKSAPPRKMPETGAVPPGEAAPGEARRFGRLRIPRLGIATEVVEGADPASLRRAPGHMVGSARPGDPDNCIIAGHRSGAFGRLRGARPGDVIEVSGSGREARYRVVSLEIVPRAEVGPLRPERRAVLTLVTCHPFDQCGPAPDRLIIRGVLDRATAPRAGTAPPRPDRS